MTKEEILKKLEDKKQRLLKNGLDFQADLQQIKIDEFLTGKVVDVWSDSTCEDGFEFRTVYFSDGSIKTENYAAY